MTGRMIVTAFCWQRDERGSRGLKASKSERIWVLLLGGRSSLLDWRGFDAQHAKTISGAGGWFSGGCLGGGVARAICGGRNGTGGGCRTQHALSGGGAGAHCRGLVSVPRFHRWARG